MNVLTRSAMLCLALALVAGAAASPTVAADREDVAKVRQTIGDAMELKRSIEESLVDRPEDVRADVEKLLRPASNDLLTARRRLADGQVEAAGRDADSALRSLRKAEKRLDPKQGR